ncbi:hypothetical protein BC939DRAFT_508309 [Gamsiella multidivaricata]|uniref:uncharacterized protein n=1 Tax=Gamsiella multidivaricata TaxID=101098 RepID=UPI00221F4453|nr:uncharacterized protein BC939DRAFT_508309 [Gamsiella multidivaricata]KAI7816424.1 hypothetical protein BC939DRAFT_508309 [Gamsiella multidivaricata]
MAAISEEYAHILDTHWGSLHEGWPAVDKAKFHRTEMKNVSDIETVKSALLDRLGYIPGFFFLTQIFGTHDYGSPYRNVEKGLLLLYALVTGDSLSNMARFVPKTSFYDLRKEFYLQDHQKLHHTITSKLYTMCSTLKLRLLLAKNNPDPFKHVTLNLDGHDSRVSYINANKPRLYSYKLKKSKKSGFRVQVCADMNNIVLFVSKPAPCKDNNDGTMLVKMKIPSLIHKLDCIALDGGYNGFWAKLWRQTQYNKAFGGFRSKIESCFADLQSKFAKFTHNAPVRFADEKPFELQFKLCCLLTNIKKLVASQNIAIQPHHGFWMQDGFDFLESIEYQESYEKQPNIKAKLGYGHDLLELQEAFMSTTVSRSSTAEPEDSATTDMSQEDSGETKILEAPRR